MLTPKDDLEARRPIWDCMQMFWMDTDPAFEIAAAAKVCAPSKYTLDELQCIFLNEVQPAVSFNLYKGPAPEWSGFDTEWLSNEILKKHRFGKSLPMKIFNNYSYGWWARLRAAIRQEREQGPAA